MHKIDLTTENIQFTFADSTALYHACRSTDSTEQQRAYQELWRYLYGVTYQLMGDQADGGDLAQDCAQRALVRIHQRLIECQEPAAFRSWTRRIASNLAIDELRRRRRLSDLPDPDHSVAPLSLTVAAPEATVLATMQTVALRELLQKSPMSARSQRVVIGRYLDETSDEELAQTESSLSKTAVLPSHIQVTRAKNLAKLREWARLQEFL